uniref:Zinc finger PMZ-type domain-containing protein n=1 Tax=Fagus sylvatica TaxID=28930 RepID=A0A2N9F2M6_FAGSY
MVAECGSPSTSLVYYLIPGEGGVEPLQVVGLDGVVGQSDFGGVVDEGDELEGDYFSTGDELEGDELNEGDEGNVFEGDELNELVSYDWMNDGLERADFADDIFGGNEDEDDNEPSMQAEVGSNGGNNASDAQSSMQPEIRVRQYAPSTTRPNQPDVQAPDWTEPGIEDYEIHTDAISNDEDPRDRAPEFNQQTDMRKPDLVNKAVDIKFKLNEKTKIFVHCKNDCGWRLYASVVPGELTFQIKTFQSVCTCGKSFQHSQVNSSYVARKYLQDFGKNPKWEVAGVQHHVRQDISVELSRNQVYRAKRKAREMLEGDEKLQYAALWDYAAMIRKTNVGTASIEREFERRMEYLKGLDEKAWKWLSKILAKQWCKAYFTKRALSDCLVNNISKSFNDMILSARDKPILSMLEWIRVRLMTRLHMKRIGVEKYGGSVCSNVQDKLEKLKMESMIWDLTGIPCKHGVAAIYKNLKHPEDYLHDCYLKEAYLNVYSEIIHPMPGQDEWIKSGHLPPQPPHVLRPLGRPKKLRRRDPDEPRNPHKPVSVRDSIARGAGSGAGRGRGAESGAGKGKGAGSGVGRGRGATSGAGSGAVVQAEAGVQVGVQTVVQAWVQPVVQAWVQPVVQASGAGRGSISGQASGASRSWTNGAAVKNLGEKRTRGNGSSRPPKLPVIGGKGK